MSDRTHQSTLTATEDEELDTIDWTFPAADTQYLTHGLHTYPARMIPQIPDALLNHFLDHSEIEEGDTVYDPFSGSGTTAVEARLHGLNAKANDINPFACMLTKAKAIPIERPTLDAAYRDLRSDLKLELRKLTETYESDEEIEIDLPAVREGRGREPEGPDRSDFRVRMHIFQGLLDPCSL